jgi:hypothetical protein
MMPIPGPVMLNAPTVRQRRIAIEFRLLRERAGLSIPGAAKKLLGTDPQTWEQIENAERRTSWLVLRRLLDELAVTDEDYRSYLLSLLVDGRERTCDQVRGWMQEFPSRVVGSVPEYRRMYIGLNAGAHEKRMYQPSIVPGILQTRDYAAAIAAQVLRAGKPELDEAVTARVARADRLTGPDPLVAHAVISESALRLQIGSPQVMAGQYQRLRELAELGNVTIQVLPLNASAQAAFPAPFVLLDYRRPVGNPGIAYIEHLTRTAFMDDPDEIADYRTAWNRVTTAALNPAASTQFIQVIADGHHPSNGGPDAQPTNLA